MQNVLHNNIYYVKSDKYGIDGYFNYIDSADSEYYEYINNDKTGLSPGKIRKLISVNKMSNRIKMFDGYALDSSSGKLKRRMWYKLCLNGLKT